MDIKKGHIFSRGIIKGQTASGEWQVVVEIASKPVIFILENKYVPPDIRIKRDTPIYNIVVIKHKNEKFYVALYKYWDTLIKYYYPNSYWNETAWNFWYSRWKDECAEKFKDNFSVINIKTDHKPPLSRYYGLKGQGYILPIRGYRDIDFMHGPQLFFPDVFKLSDDSPPNEPKASRSVYKENGLGSIPLTYKAKIVRTLWGSTVGETKDVHVFLHGFPSPAKLHFDVWKHLLGFRDGKEKEAALWHKDFDKELNKEIGTINKSLFNSCKPNHKNKSCDEPHCVNSSLFKTIHPKIKPLCGELFKQIVTLLESNATNTLKITEEPIGNVKRIFLTYIKEETRNSARQYLVFKGISYNFEANIPTLHIIPITLFFETNPNFMPIDQFDNNKLIFTGSLKEIQQCQQM